jgi:serine/threonine protein kinase
MKATAETSGSAPQTGPDFDSIPTELDGLPTDIPRGERGRTTATDPAVRTGDIIAGKFEITRLIGKGGMGRVYLARERIANGERERNVALKIISEEHVGSDRAVQRLLDEGLVTQDLAHRNIVKVYDIGMHGAQPYIAMEYIEGEALHVWRGKKIASGEPVPVRTVAQIVKEVLNGLEEAHEAGVVHRDLKPENIMLLDAPSDNRARIKIVDFGIALATKTPTDSSGTGMGTRAYMAPEQLRNADMANPSADLYSVSRIFYELIVGVLPTGHWQPPSDGRSDVPSGIDKLIEDGLSLNRDVRPQTAARYRERMIEAINNPRRDRVFDPGRTASDKKEALAEARKDMKDAYIRAIRNMPVWGWIVIGLIAVVLALPDILA